MFFDSYRNYLKMRRELEHIKVSDFKELNTMLDKAQDIEKKLIEKENEATKIKLDHQHELNELRNNHLSRESKIKIEHENEIMSLNQALELEKQRVHHEAEKKVDLANHKIGLARREFEKEKEGILLKVQTELLKTREDFLEKNYGDLKDEANNAVDRALKTVGMFIDKVSPTKRQEIEGPKDVSLKQVDVYVNLNK